MILQSPSNSSNQTEVTTKKSALVSLQQRGNGYSTSAVTGTMAAALAANSSIFAMRLDVGAGDIRAYIERVRIQFTTIVAFTVPVTAGRRLALFRGSGNNTAGGTAITTMVKKNSATSPLSEFDTAQGGDVRISATSALTVTGITYEAEPIAIMQLVHVGAVGGFYEWIFEFNANGSAPLVLQPGQLLALRNPQVMDAGGTWQACIKVDWYEENVATL